MNHVIEKKRSTLKTINLNIRLFKCTYHDSVDVYVCALRKSLNLEYWMKNKIISYRYLINHVNVYVRNMCKFFL